MKSALRSLSNARLRKMSRKFETLDNPAEKELRRRRDRREKRRWKNVY